MVKQQLKGKGMAHKSLEILTPVVNYAVIDNTLTSIFAKEYQGEHDALLRHFVSLYYTRACSHYLIVT